MSFTLYAALVPSQIQVLNSLLSVLDKAKSHVAAGGLAEQDLCQAKLAPDMLPLVTQFVLTVAHSVGAIEGVRKGEFVPSLGEQPADLAALTTLTADAHAAMSSLDPEEINAFVGRPMRFAGRAMQHDFLAEDYLLSFSQPNFFFHAVTAYDVLRNQGVAIGKRDYLGQMRVKM